MPRQRCLWARPRPLLPDGRVLRVPRDDRRRRQPPGLHDAPARRHGRRLPARQAERRRMIRLTSTAELHDRYDVVIVGAGPAGMAAAAEAGGHRPSPLLLGAKPRARGPSFPAVPTTPP